MGDGSSSVAVEGTFAAGDVVVIDMERQAVTVNGVDVTARVLLESDFFALVPGGKCLGLLGLFFSLRELGREVGLMAVPTLYLFDRWDERLGVLPTLGFMTHTEGLGGEDTLEFDCLVAPEKGDRLVWRDPDTGAWREHEVVRTNEETAGIAHVYAESSLCELLRDFVEEEQLVAKTVSQAMAAVVAHTRWSLGTVSCDDSTKRGALLCHSNALAALRRVESVWDGELKYSYEVSDGRISKRTVSLRMSATTEVVGFQHLSGMTTAKQCFVSRTDLESVYATSFDTSALTAGYQMFYGCQKLVGGTDGTVVGNLTAHSICKLGEGGVLTDPGNDTRQWFWGTVYADGYLEISASSDVTWSRGVAGGPRPGQVPAGLRAAVVGREGPLHQGQGEGRHGDGGVHRTQHELLVLCVRGRDKLRGAGEPEVRLADAACVLVVHGCDGARPDRLRPLLAHGPFLRLRGVLGAHDDLRGCGLDPALRLHWEPVLLQLQEPRGRERHGPG